ncbi:hypothetical protein ON010_g14336 [Phytophthora cinnamomi]|nr:hypothetical protein ON010_g14336 [Phytophthora cinnamomi]
MRRSAIEHPGRYRVTWSSTLVPESPVECQAPRWLFSVRSSQTREMLAHRWARRTIVSHRQPSGERAETLGLDAASPLGGRSRAGNDGRPRGAPLCESEAEVGPAEASTNLAVNSGGKGTMKAFGSYCGMQRRHGGLA